MIVWVVTPTLNAAQFLPECIASVQRNNTSRVEVEHVIVDGGSSDETVAIAEAAGVRVMSGRDSGIFDAINKGSFAASGQLLGFLGADDVMLERALDAVVEAYEGSGRRWIVGGIRWIDENGHDFGGLAAPPAWMTVRMHVCVGWNPIMHMATYIARDLFAELGGFDIKFRDAGDYDMFARAREIEPFYRLDRPLACFRHTGMNNSVRYRERALAEWADVRQRFGPGSNVERRLWNVAMRSWFNFRNPGWMIGKAERRAAIAVGRRQARHS
jgi:glycosyltransferase involved in cell wall biosynthesis